jgi:hypothetical protein
VGSGEVAVEDNAVAGRWGGANSRPRSSKPSIIHAVTSGGRAPATEILVYKVHRGGEGLDLGGSSAQSVILMLIVIALTVLQFRYIERRVQYH